MRVVCKSRQAQCIDVLRDGPATTGEVADELGTTAHLAGAHLWNLYAAGRLERRVFHPLSGRVCWLWSLPGQLSPGGQQHV